MNDFEKEMLTLLKSLDSRMSTVENEISGMKSEISEMKDKMEEMNESLEITRAAANYNGEKLDDLVEELKSFKVIA